MKERPILFSAPMVRAILDGTKTQTRRVVKPVGNDDGFVILDYGDGGWPYRSDDGDSTTHTVKRGGKLYHDETPHTCPYGQPGDRLWVRETFHTVDGHSAFYRADYAHDPKGDKEHGIVWTPSIHMPRWASRITLEVTSVRVERLNDITPIDACAEGLSQRTAKMHHRRIEQFGLPGWRDVHWRFSPVDAYRMLWEQINGAGSWEANPWVWVIEFEVVK